MDAKEIDPTVNRHVLTYPCFGLELIHASERVLSNNYFMQLFNP